MKLEEEMLINKYGQGLVNSKELLSNFNTFESEKKRTFLTDMTFLILQSKPNDNDIETAILESKLKPTYTPCILLKKGITSHNLNKIIALPENELDKVFLLFLSLFKIPYQRRFQEEKNHPDKWWYWELSDENRVKMILKSYK
ncbi:hypothetical protein SAMN04487911_12510 [Arenibacter nanhaiticus]|uniref:Uncharacterized protein n=1 Tax=Arenibacter nanhaiticus TaxID=558155 RepID=A0A1M6KAR7_9FLAO|nr:MULTISPECIES: DUF5958 family protein [Arenibacter]NKI25390.1 hypothetical protein [Arenibacter sp. 6A1]SHJ56036.1 hypothetical protein SAMN04487911_12510 [Arenibacter nanhaiticus]